MLQKNIWLFLLKHLTFYWIVFAHRELTLLMKNFVIIFSKFYFFNSNFIMFIYLNKNMPSWCKAYMSCKLLYVLFLFNLNRY